MIVRGSFQCKQIFTSNHKSIVIGDQSHFKQQKQVLKPFWETVLDRWAEDMKT